MTEINTTEKSIEEIINEELTSDDKAAALEFSAFLKDKGLIFYRDRNYWKNKIYFWIRYNNNDCICFISICDPDEPNNRWTVWSDDMDPAYLNDNAAENSLKETAWKHIDFCGSCGSCGGGRKKMIFGRNFDNVCGCTFRVDNPNKDDLVFLKKMVDIRIKELDNKNAETIQK